MTNYPNDICLLKGDLVEAVATLIATHAQNAIEEDMWEHTRECDVEVDEWVDWEKREFLFQYKVDGERDEERYGLDTPVMEIIYDLYLSIEATIRMVNKEI